MEHANGAESGGVTWRVSDDGIVGTDVKTGQSQTDTRTLGELGPTGASQLRIVFNANEPVANGISLDNLILTIYGADGTELFNCMSGNGASRRAPPCILRTGRQGGHP